MLTLQGDLHITAVIDHLDRAEKRGLTGQRVPLGYHESCWFFLQRFSSRERYRSHRRTIVSLRMRSSCSPFVSSLAASTLFRKQGLTGDSTAEKLPRQGLHCITKSVLPFTCRDVARLPGTIGLRLCDEPWTEMRGIRCPYICMAI